MILFLALRYNTGWDYWWYLDESKSVARNGVTNRALEGAWVYIFSLSKIFNLYWLPISVVGIVTLLLIYRSLKLVLQNESYIKTALLVFAFFPDFYFSTFTIIRQWLAMAVGLFFFSLFLTNKRKVLMLILFVISVIFSTLNLHSSSGIMLLFIPIYYWATIFKKHRIVGLLLLITLFTILVLSINQIVTTYMPGYEQYFKIEADYGKIMKYIYLFLFLLVLLSYNKLQNNENALHLDPLLYLTLIGLMSAVIIVEFIKSGFINRISSYLILEIIFIAPYIIENSLRKKILYAILLVGIFLGYLYWIQPAQSKNFKYIPYETIFNVA